MSFDPGAAAAADSGIYGLASTLDESAVVVLPVPFEATTSYGGGASKGPAALLAASRQVDLFDRATGRPYEAGIFMLEEDAEIRSLNTRAKRHAAKVIERAGRLDDEKLARRLSKVNRAGDRVNQIVHAMASSLIARGKLVATVGGDHASPFGAIQAHAEAFDDLGILHLDAHADMRPAYEGFTWSHASIFYNVLTRIERITKLVQVGIRDYSEEEAGIVASSGGRAILHHDDELVGQKFDGVPWSRIVKRIVKDLPKNVYLSFDIDGLDPTLCPHTGTPVPGGLSFQETVHLLSAVHASGRRIVGLDLCEVVPGPPGDEWDANVAARLLYKMIGYALMSRPT